MCTHTPSVPSEKYNITSAHHCESACQLGSIHEVNPSWWYLSWTSSENTQPHRMLYVCLRPKLFLLLPIGSSAQVHKGKKNITLALWSQHPGSKTITDFKKSPCSQNPNPSLSHSYTAAFWPGRCRSLSVRVLLPLPFHRRPLLHLQPRPAGGRRAEIPHRGSGVTAPPQSCGTDQGTHPTASHLYYSWWIFTGGDREK